MAVDGFSGCGIVCSALAQTGRWSSYLILAPAIHVMLVYSCSVTFPSKVQK